MGTPYMSEIRIMSFNFAPQGWAMCNGQILPINQNQALFSLLGTTYGGNGSTNFALPDLRGRVPMHMDNNPGGHTQGEKAGEQAHTVTISELPTHTHVMQAKNVKADANATAIPPSPTVSLAQAFAVQTGGAQVDVNRFSNSQSFDLTLNPAAITSVGGSQPHENRQPYLALTFCIALQGFFPDHN
jgi:microcystin-dependent protein